MRLFSAESLIAIFAPHSCLLCNREGLPVCKNCTETLARPKKPVCFLCNSLSEDFKTCRSCSRKTTLRRVWVASRYEAYVKQLIREFKFERNRAAHVPLSQLIIQSVVARDYDLICPVPCASSRFRKRGYNQSWLLASAVSKTWHIPCQQVLLRHGQARQVGLARSERLAQLSTEFWAVKSVRGKKILLIDDVATTGATLDNCAKVLKRAGAKHVEAAVIARA